MSNTNIPVPPGWYQAPNETDKDYLRWWDGTAWTEHTTPVVYSEPQTFETEKNRPTIYWSNLFRIRTWWFSLAGSAAIVFALSYIGLGFVFYLWPLLAILIGWFWMTQQMQCRLCGTLLRVTRLTGGQEVCHKCHAPTDAQLKRQGLM